jgi:hypothetical protein
MNYTYLRGDPALNITLPVILNSNYVLQPTYRIEFENKTDVNKSSYFTYNSSKAYNLKMFIPELDDILETVSIRVVAWYIGFN